MLYWVGLHMKSIPMEHEQNRFGTLPYMKDKTS